MRTTKRYPKVLEMMHYLKEYAPRPTKIHMPSVCKFFNTSTITAHALLKLEYVTHVGNRKSGEYVWNKNIKSISNKDAIKVVKFIREYEKATYEGLNRPLKNIKAKVQKQVEVKKAKATETSLSHFMVEVPGTSIKLKVIPVYN